MVTLRRWFGLLVEAGAVQHMVGWMGLVLIIGGVWGLFGWECASIVAGSPIAAFYLFGQVREVRGPGMAD